MKIEIIQGNIVKQPDVEAVVNSANANLRLGSGVAGAIHTAAGPKLEEYCKPFAPLAYGAYLVTPGFKLPNLWVIHVRAASYENHQEAQALLQSCIDPVKNCSGVIFEGNTDEHTDGRRHQTLDSQT